jgi:exonuclease SbcD
LRILHTADWHIGKILHKQELREELVLFFDWLIETIQSEAIDILLVSGDVFDLANPAVKDRELYYQFLSRLLRFDIKVIITGGNHDAVGLLNAPQKILQHLNINIIGGAADSIEDELIPIEDAEGNTTLVVAAVPFLRDRDLRNQNTDKQYKNRTEAIREGIKSHYAQLSDICLSKYPNTPVIAMGHLYASGSITSESERDIHIGNAAAVDAAIFSDVYNYVALGHIHRPQIVSKNQNIRYSGSPIALSFSERKDTKSVVIVNVDDGKISDPQIVTVPKNRELRKIKGTEQEVIAELESYAPNYTLPSFVELDVIEENFNPITISRVDSLVSSYADQEKFKILKSRVTFLEGGKDTSELFAEGTHIDDITPLDVFKKMLDQRSTESEDRQLLEEAFSELLDETLESEGI